MIVLRRFVVRMIGVSPLAGGEGECPSVSERVSRFRLHVFGSR